MNSNGNNIAPVYGLVLAGGKSSRMGTDKGIMDWHGKKQRSYLADLLAPLCDHVFISCRKEQSVEIVDEGYRIIEDAYDEAGPYGALLSAFDFKSNVAWFVLACDLPLIDEDTLVFLLNERDPSKAATTFRSPFDKLPEPLITIWEPRSYQTLIKRKEEGKTCPRKALLNSNIKIINPPEPDALFNANTPDDMEKIKEIFNGRRLASL